MMMRLRGQALAMSSSSSSSYSLLRRVASSPRSIVHCSSTRPLVSYRGFRVAPLPATAIARLELRGTSPVVLRSRLSSVSVRASSHLASDAGSIDSSMMQSMENKVQRMVYKAVWEELQSTVHAFGQMVTNTPEEANRNQ